MGPHTRFVGVRIEQDWEISGLDDRAYTRAVIGASLVAPLQDSQAANHDERQLRLDRHLQAPEKRDGNVQEDKICGNRYG